MALPLFGHSTTLKDTNVPCCLGIDEAGRGPVLGPMVYGAAYCAIDQKETLAKVGFKDSKVLNESQRDLLFQKIVNSTVTDDNASTTIKKLGMEVGFLTEVLEPEFLSQQMQRMAKVNLNTISHNAAIALIKRALEFGINVKEVFVDTVGTPSKYQAKLKHHFPDIEITVSKKADSLFPIVSAASICAKVVRDHRLKHWQWKEPNNKCSTKFGSGYPADPTTKDWLKNNLDPIFAYPSIIRFSWKTTQQMIDKAAFDVEWSTADMEVDNYKIKDRNERFRYYADNGMEVVTEF